MFKDPALFLARLWVIGAVLMGFLWVINPPQKELTTEVGSVIGLPPMESTPTKKTAPVLQLTQTQSQSVMRTNQRGVNIIKQSEGLRLEAYQGFKGEWYIGYGHGGDVSPGMTITEKEAEKLLREDLRSAEKAIKDSVKVQISLNQFSAMVSLAYNIGNGNFRSSTVLKKLNAGDYEGAAEAFLMWNKVSGKAYEHLTRRRMAEKELFLS